jgi:hypothetical protein
LLIYPHSSNFTSISTLNHSLCNEDGEFDDNKRFKSNFTTCVEKLVESEILHRPPGHSHSIYIKADGIKKFTNDAYTLSKDGTFKHHAKKAGGKKKTGGAKKKKKTKGKSRAKKTAEESAEESAGEAVAA